MSQSDTISVVALAVSLVAFGVATGQLLQSLFGTADGYRRCQASVIGWWAEMTERKWRWSEFRFETKFTTPHIFLYPVIDEGQPRSDNPVLKINQNVIYIDSTLQSRRKTYSDELQSKDGETDTAGWLILLYQLYTLQSQYKLRQLPWVQPGVQ